MIKQRNAPPVEDQQNCYYCEQPTHEGEKGLFPIIGHLYRVPVTIEGLNIRDNFFHFKLITLKSLSELTRLQPVVCASKRATLSSSLRLSCL